MKMSSMKAFFFALFASLITSVVYAAEVTEDFESVTIVDASGNPVSGNYTAGVGLSNGWKVVGGNIYGSYDYGNYGLWSTAHGGSKALVAAYGSSNAANVVIPEELSGSLKFYVRRTSTSTKSSYYGKLKVYTVEENGSTYTIKSTLKSETISTASQWIEYSVDLGDDPVLVAFNLIYLGLDDVTYNTYEAADGPRLQVLQGEQVVKSGAEYNFGLVGEESTVTYTLKNAGTQTLSATLSCTGVYTVSQESVSIEAGESTDVTITLPVSTMGTNEGQLTITPDGLDAFTINLAGIVRDPAKIYQDFTTTPADWTMGGWTVNAAGYATIGYNYYYSNTSISSNKALQTSLLKVSEGEQLFIRYRKNYNSSYSNGTLCFWASVDGTTWTKVGDNVTATDYDVWHETTVSGFPTSAKYIAISGQYIDIDDFYGFELSSLPVMTIVGETVSDNTITQNFGKQKTDATKTYTVSNIGADVLHVDIANTNNTDFAVSETSLDVASGETATFDVQFNFSSNYGVKTTTVTLTPNAGDVININVSADAQDPEEYTEDFENGIPASWTNKGWTIENAPSYGNGTKMVYSGYYNTNTLTSPRLQAKAGDVIDIEALQKYNDEPLTLDYSLDDGETWGQGFSEVPAADNTLHTLHFTAPEDGIYILRFSGRYNYIDNICGFKLAQIPVMAVSTTGGATKEGDVFTDNFGHQTADASHTYTVANTGAGTLVVNIASNSADFTVSETTLEMGAGESKTFDVTFVHSNVYGNKAAAITITPTYEGLNAVTINATALCVDPDAFFEDFENGVPATWTNYGWSIQTKNGSKMAYSNTSDEYKLTTPMLYANEEDVFAFDAFQQWDDEPLKLEYSTDGGENWTTAFEEAPATNNTARQFEFTAPADGFYLIRFSGSYNYIDNVCGFKLAQAMDLVAKGNDDKYYATFSSEQNVVFAPWVKVCTVEYTGDIVLSTNEVENHYVPAETGVLLVSDGTKVAYKVADGMTSQIPAENMLHAASEDMTSLSDCLFYRLAYDDYSAKTDLGFYWGAADGAAFDAKAGTAYLAVPNDEGNVRSQSFVFGQTETSVQKLTGTAVSHIIYNLRGQRIATMQKGINIVDGRKIVVR